MAPPNVLVVVLDSLRTDHVGCYGSDRVETPSVDAFAAHPDTARFTNAYPDALPTIPTRSALFTGQRTLPFRPWRPLSDEDVTLAEILGEHGYATGLVTDTYHMAKPGMNFHRGFDSFRWIRGQERDAYRAAPADVDLDAHVKDAMADSPTADRLEQYLRNVADRDRDDESAFFAARVMDEARAWLERNRDRQFFLWVDSFDPHEPWDPPASYRGRHTDPGYDGPDLIHPKFGDDDWLDDDELAHVRGRYAEEVEFVDAQVGRLFETLRSLGLFEETLVVLLSDHGVALGEHGRLMKPADALYGELVEIPLLVKPPASHPAAGGASEVDALAQTHDVPATLLDLLGLDHETRAMHGESLQPELRGERDGVRDAVVTGFHGSDHRCVRSRDWSLIVRPDGERDELYDLAADPDEQRNCIDRRPEVAERLAAQVGHCFRADSYDDKLQSVTMVEDDAERRDVEARLADLGYR